MLQSEFDRLTSRPYTEAEFSEIHYIYCYHPAVQSKKDIADLWTIGGICLDDNAKTVTVDGDPVALTPKEYDILRFLMRNAGTVFSPNEIYRRVWEDVPLNAAGAIAVHIRHLREKLEINPSEPRYIKVVWGKGYKMEGGIS